jgi:hypothetical protein
VFYNFPVVIPANTTEDDPYEVDAPLTHGVIHRLEVEFPDWHRGQTHARILHRGFQLWPSNPQSDFSSNDHTIVWNDYYPLLDRPFGLRLIGWNSDDTFPHTVTVRIGVLPVKVAEHLFGRMKNTDLSQLRKSFNLDEGAG